MFGIVPKPILFVYLTAGARGIPAHKKRTMKLFMVLIKEEEKEKQI